jgi:lysine-N-methylase
MKIVKPHYFNRFRCLAGACPDSCCQEWEVQIDDATAQRYLSLDGDLGDAIRKHLYTDDGDYYLRITDRRCPMWRQDGLCRIQAELGASAMSHVCREFPRLRHDYGDFLELGLEMSCPEAARLILTEPYAPFLVEEASGGDEPEYDTEAMDVLLRTRETALAILTSHPLPQALTLLLLYGYRAQNELDGGEEAPWSPAAELALGKKFASKEPLPLTDFFAGLEILTPRWAERLHSPSPGDWQEELRAIARYGIQRYWLQAVSDYDLVCRVKLVIASCILIRHLGGDILETAQLYSKEIENSAENIESILDGAYTHPALTDANLLGLLRQ